MSFVSNMWPLLLCILTYYKTFLSGVWISAHTKKAHKYVAAMTEVAKLS